MSIICIFILILAIIILFRDTHKLEPIIDGSVDIDNKTYRFYYVTSGGGATGSSEMFLNLQNKGEPFNFNKNVIISFKQGDDIEIRKSNSKIYIYYPDSATSIYKKNHVDGIDFVFNKKKSNNGFINEDSENTIRVLN